MKGIRR